MEQSSEPRFYSQQGRGEGCTSSYAISSSKLLYYLERGFALELPLSGWYRRNQQESPLHIADWEAFTPPCVSTYASYVARQSEREAQLDKLFAEQHDRDYGAQFSAQWLRVLATFFAPQRYLVHGLQMQAAYVGHMAPSGRITIVALFQAANELRRIDRMADYLLLLRQQVPDLVRSSTEQWQQAAPWQVVRRAVEQMLVTYDFGEAWVALNLVFKPHLDGLLLRDFAEQARHHQDALLQQCLQLWWQDSLWQQEWSAELQRLLEEQSEANGAIISQWRTRWLPQTEAAGVALLSLMG